MKLFPEVSSTLGLSGAFFLNAAFCLAGSVFVVVYLPETHGLTLTELSKLFAEDGEGETGSVATVESDDVKKEMMIKEEKEKEAAEEAEPLVV